MSRCRVPHMVVESGERAARDRSSAGTSRCRVAVARAAVADRSPVVQDFVRCCLDVVRPD
ncbi:hypothetical protein V5F01_13165 [Streptomyces sp. NRRL B-2790]|uniref:hypothetical protein n=1 Tax=Streptomyces sp. NRRL B-2790 TaxID=1463835 RepID=UPI003569455C